MAGFDNVSNVVATTIKTAKEKAKWATMNKEMNKRFRKPGLSSWQLLDRIYNTIYDINQPKNIDYTYIQIPIKYDATYFKAHIQFFFKDHKEDVPLFSIRFVLNDDALSKLDNFMLNDNDEGEFELGNLQEEQDKFMTSPIVDEFSKKAQKLGLELKIFQRDQDEDNGVLKYSYIMQTEFYPGDDHSMQFVDYFCQKYIDNTKEITLNCLYSRYKHDKTTENQLRSLIKEWNIYKNVSTGGGHSTTSMYVVFDGKKRKIQINNLKQKFIIINKQVVLLSSIRNKYKYIK